MKQHQGCCFRWQGDDVWDFVFEFTVTYNSEKKVPSIYKKKSFFILVLQDMYNKIETNDDGDISMKHVVIHLKGDDSAF